MLIILPSWQRKVLSCRWEWPPRLTQSDLQCQCLSDSLSLCLSLSHLCSAVVWGIFLWPEPTWWTNQHCSLSWRPLWVQPGGRRTCRPPPRRCWWRGAQWPTPCRQRASSAFQTCLNDGRLVWLVLSPDSWELSYQELTNEHGGHLSKRDETEVDEDIARQVLSVQSSCHVEEVVDSPEDGHGDEQSSIKETFFAKIKKKGGHCSTKRFFFSFLLRYERCFSTLGTFWRKKMIFPLEKLKYF